MQALLSLPDLLTQHGRRRMDARRIPMEGVEAALDWGRAWRGKRSCEGLRLDRRTVERAGRQGKDLRPYEGITVIQDSMGNILTVYRDRTGRRLQR
jgi:hypothetical protein